MQLTWATLLCLACAEPERGILDRGPGSGVSFTHDSGFRDTYYFPETVGSGVATVDLDGDGDVDIYALQCGVVPGSPEDTEPRPVNKLFANRGDGSFDDQTGASGDAASDRYSMGVCAGDVNGNGAVDLFVTNCGPDQLLINRGALRFEDTAGGTQLADSRWTTGCAFGDLDRDGHLDLVVAGYVYWDLEQDKDCSAGNLRDYCHITAYDGIGDRVWRGNGAGEFEERTQQWGLTRPGGRAFNLTLADLNEDGWLDLFVANDSVENHLYLNDGTGALVDHTDRSGTAYNLEGLTEAGMGVATGDINADGRMDLLVTNFAGESNALYENLGDGSFRDASRKSGITAISRAPLGFGALFADFDRDGLLDLVVSNGHVMRNAGITGSDWGYPQPDQVLRGTESGRFEVWPDVSPALDIPRVGRGLAAGDLDDDGELDLVLLGSSEELLVTKTKLAAPGSHWLRVQLKAKGSNTMGIGSRLRLELSNGELLTRWVLSGVSFLSQDDPRPHFGIPAETNAERLTINWPDGSESTVEKIALDQTILVEQ